MQVLEHFQNISRKFSKIKNTEKSNSKVKLSFVVIELKLYINIVILVIRSGKRSDRIKINQEKKKGMPPKS